MITSMKSSCDLVLNSVRSSNLNYMCQETPFSIFLTIRKSYLKTFNPAVQITTMTSSDTKLELMEKAFERLKCDHEEVIAENESHLKTIITLEEKVEILHNKIDVDEVRIKSFEVKVKTMENEMNRIDKKQVHTTEEKKALNVEVEEALKKLAGCRKSLKTEAKENRDIVKDLNKKIETSDNTINDLKGYKTVNETLMKDIKAAEERAKKQEKDILEKEEQLKDMREKELKRLLKVNDSTQTDSNPDTPYRITDPLPPIFSSQLCHQSPRIHLLTKSLPNVNTIDWVTITPEEALRDEAEEALSQHHDDQISYFYKEATERARAKKKELNNNNTIDD